MERPHHPVFDRFARWEGDVPGDAQANWLGVMTSGRLANWQTANWQAARESSRVRPDLPEIDSEEYPEWIDLLEAASAAGDRFAMVELGAGWGRWLVNGAFAYRQLNPNGSLSLVGVEAEPTHFRWLGEHVCANGLGEDADLIGAAVAGTPGRVTFDVGNSLGYWGQSIQAGTTWQARVQRLRRRRRAVGAITLEQALRSVPGLIIDLIDLDVQGAEADVLTSGVGELDRVRRVHIGTHGADPEERLRALFTSLGWICKTDYPAFSVASTTWWGGEDVAFQDGVQSWLNPAL